MRPIRIRIALMLATAILLPLAFAPYGQFYLAWIGLAPWLVLVSTARSQKAAFAWGWITGTIYFLLSFPYLLSNTIPGALGLAMFLAQYWGYAALIIRGAGLLAGSASADRLFHRACAIAAIWVSAEFLWGTILTGMPWGFLGHSQSPLLAMCQIADITGVYGISFWVVLINTLVAMVWMHPSRWRQAIPSAAVLAIALGAIVIYGVYRLSQGDVLRAGPRVLIIQPNDYSFRDKSAEAKQREYLSYHLKQTDRALESQQVDLIVWSETTMPALNQEVRDELSRYPTGAFLNQVHGQLIEVAQKYNAALLAGGYFVGGWKDVNGRRTGTDIRNAAFFYTRKGRQIARYDKTHLVPFGEYTPFKESIPWLYKLLKWIGPHEWDYVLHRGGRDSLTAFPLDYDSGQTCRFVSPICFDGSDAALLADMFRGNDGSKRADFIVAISNDGWFKLNERAQHLQAEQFRSIENRAPQVRCVNTGISGFVDSCGRIQQIIPADQEGTLARDVMLDRRVTFYTRFRDVFAWFCTGITVSIALLALARHGIGRRTGRLSLEK